MTYNTERPHMPLPEYGRCVHEMVAHLRTLYTPLQREKCARTIVRTMAIVRPEIKQQPDWEQMAWSHLAYMVGYDFELPSPYEVTRLGEQAAKPSPLSYKKCASRDRQIGRYLTECMEKGLISKRTADDIVRAAEERARQEGAKKKKKKK